MSDLSFKSIQDALIEASARGDLPEVHMPPSMAEEFSRETGRPYELMELEEGGYVARFPAQERKVTP